MSDILEGVLHEFEKLAAIPRPSKHEERVSIYLRDYLKAMGLDVMRDAHNNVIAEIPGKTNTPLTILQAHMDMVCVAEADYKFDPLNDPIKLILDGNYLTAEGTSLGADDGIGIATILYVIKNHKFDIPLRIIFTTDEEQGMTGASGIDKKYFEDAEYLINCDSEIFDELVVGSAGNIHVDFRKKISRVRPSLNRAFAIKIVGLRGGHSGIEIFGNRANAVKLANDFLRIVNERDNIQLANFAGGKAYNVIAESAGFAIITDIDDGIMNECIANFTRRFQNIYGDDEPNFRIECSEIARPAEVLTARDFESFADMITLIHSGVYSTSPMISANIGIAQVDDNICVKILARSNVSERLDDLTKLYTRISKLTGIDVEFGTPSPAWNHNPKSHLAEIMAKIFEEQNGFKPKIHISHGGLECSFFANKNPNLDIVSVGTTNESIHSTNERLHLNTIEPHVNLIVDTLSRIISE